MSECKIQLSRSRNSLKTDIIIGEGESNLKDKNN